MHNDPPAQATPVPQLSPRAASHPLGVVLGLLRADAPGQVTGSPGSWPRWAVLLPNVLAAADHLQTAPAANEGMLGDASWCLTARAPTCRATHGWPTPGRCSSAPWPS